MPVLRLLLRFLLCLALLLALGVLSAWAGNTHTNVPSDALSQLGAWFGDLDDPQVLTGACTPTAPGSGASILNWSCKGYVRGSAGDLVYVQQTAMNVGPLTGGDGTYWLAIHRDTSTALSGWTRQVGTHYLWQKAATQPTAPAQGLLVASAMVVGPNITTVTILDSGGSGVARSLHAVVVSECASGGTGTQADPWTGWDTHCLWQVNTQYLWPQGFYRYATAPNWALTGIRLVGLGKVTLLYTGTAEALKFDGSTNPDAQVNNVAISNFTVNGTATTTVGLSMKNLFRSAFRQIRFRNIGGAVAYCNWCVGNIYEMLVYSHNETGSAEIPLTVIPTSGMTMDGPVGKESSANTLLNCMFEGVNGDGIVIDHAQETYIHGGTSEENVGYGIHLTANSHYNHVFDIDTEKNKPQGGGVFIDIIDKGSWNDFIGTLGNWFHLGPGGVGSSIVGGKYFQIDFDVGALSIRLVNVSVAHCLVDHTGGTVQVRALNIWNTNANAWGSAFCTGDNLTINFDVVGSLLVHDRLFIGPASINPQTGLATSLSADEPFHVVGGQQSNLSQRGILQLWNKEDLTQHIFIGMDTSIGTKGRMYWGASKAGNGMPGIWGPASPAPFRISTVTRGSLGGLEADIGMMIWCSDCLKASDPCAGSGQGAYAQKDGTNTWRCP